MRPAPRRAQSSASSADSFLPSKPAKTLAKRKKTKTAPATGCPPLGQGMEGLEVVGVGLGPERGPGGLPPGRPLPPVRPRTAPPAAGPRAAWRPSGTGDSGRQFPGAQAGRAGSLRRPLALPSGEVRARSPAQLVFGLREWARAHRRLHQPRRLALLRALCGALRGVERGPGGLPVDVAARLRGRRRAGPPAGASADEVLLRHAGLLALGGDGPAGASGPGLPPGLDLTLVEAGDEPAGLSASEEWGRRRQRALQRARLKKELMRRGLIRPRTAEGTRRPATATSLDNVTWLPPEAAAAAGREEEPAAELAAATRDEFQEAWRLMCQREDAAGGPGHLGPPVTDAEAAGLLAEHGTTRRGVLVLELEPFVDRVLREAGDPAEALPIRAGPPTFGEGAVTACKFLAPPCRTTLFGPRTLDPAAAVASTEKPGAHLRLEHCYGYNGRVQRHNVSLSKAGAVMFPCAALCVLARTAGKKQARTAQTFFMGHDDDVTCLAQNDGRDLAASGQMGHTLYACVWEPALGSERARIPHETGDRAVLAVGFSRFGDKLATVVADNHHTVYVWSWRDQRRLSRCGSVQGTPGDVWGVLWNWTPGGREDEFVTFGAKHVRFWRGRNGRWAPQGPQWGAAAPQDVNCAAFLPLGLVATGHPSGEVYLWRDRRVVRTVAVHPGPAGGLGVGCMKLHVNKADARVALVTAGGDGRVRLHDLSGAATPEKLGARISGVGADFLQLPAPAGEPPAPISALDFISGPRGQWKAALGTRRCDVWEAQVLRPTGDTGRGGKAGVPPAGVSLGEGRLRVVTQGHLGQVSCATFSGARPDLFATGTDLGEVLLWDAQRHRKLHAFRFKGRVTALAFSPDGRHVAAGLARGTVAVFDLRTRQLAAKRRYARQAVGVLQYGPDGRVLAAGSAEMAVDLLAAGNGYKRTARCTGHSGTITGVDFSEDGAVIQTCSNAYEILLFDVRTGRLLVQHPGHFEWPGWTLRFGFPVMGIWTAEPDASNINSVHRDPDGHIVAVGNDSGEIKVYNWPCIFKDAPHDAYAGHAAHVMQVRFSADARRLVSAGKRDRAALQWQVLRRPRPDLPRGPSVQALKISDMLLKREPLGNEYARKRLMMMEEELERELRKGTRRKGRKRTYKAPQGLTWGLLDDKSMGWVAAPVPPTAEELAAAEELRQSLEAADVALDGVVKDIEKAVSPSSEHAVVHGEELRLSLEAADFALDGAVDTLLSPGREGLRRSVEAADRALDGVVAEMEEEEMDEGGYFLDGTLLSLGSSDDGEWGES